jgi:SPP1 family holin
MDKGTLIRTIVLFVALINGFLAMYGKSPLPFSNEQVEMFLSDAFITVAALVSWWKNNYVSKKGLAQKEVLERRGLK